MGIGWGRVARPGWTGGDARRESERILQGNERMVLIIISKRTNEPTNQYALSREKLHTPMVEKKSLANARTLLMGETQFYQLSLRYSSHP